jgi:hypothetical protein
MTHAPGSTGTTVTLFGGSDPLDHALSDQLDKRGCRTHFVSVPTGWLRSASHAIVRLDTDAGADALRQLAETPQPRSHVIAVCPEPVDASESDRVREMCRACGVHHDISLIWHPPLDTDMRAALARPAEAVAADATVATNALAASVAAEMAGHPTVGKPSFVTRPFVVDAGPH